jgi:hypothetical protein
LTANFDDANDFPSDPDTSVTRAAPGIKKGAKCLAVPKRKPKGAKPCTRQLAAAQGTTTLTKAGRGHARPARQGPRQGQVRGHTDRGRRRGQPVHRDRVVHHPMM